MPACVRGLGARDARDNSPEGRRFDKKRVRRARRRMEKVNPEYAPRI